MKRIAKNICLLLLLCACVGISVCLYGCSREYDETLKQVRETDCFRYIKYDWENTVTILELTDYGKEQEVLMIPDEIDGIKVGQIGGKLKDREQNEFSLTREYVLQSEKVKKIYFICTHSVDIHYCHFNNGTNVEVIVFTDNALLKSALLLTPKRFDYYSNVILDDEYYGYSVDFCNMFFHLNTEEESDLYWIDRIGENELYRKPLPPCRDGYVFTGWYTEKDCLNVWDGEYKIPPEEKELHVYANWIKE